MANARYYLIADKDCTLTVKRGDTDATLAEVNATAASMVTVELDSSLAPYVVADRSDVECGKKILEPGLNSIKVAYSMTTGGTSDKEVPVEFQLVADDLARLHGRINHVTGSPSSILQIDSQYYPLDLVPVNISAITVGACSLTCGILGTDGILKLANGTGGVRAAAGLQFDVQWQF